MNKNIFITCVCMIFLSILLTGCEFEPSKETPEVEPNYITVTLNVRVQVIYLEGLARAHFEDAYATGKDITEYASDIKPVPGAQVKIQLTKARGEDFIFYRTTDSTGFTELVSGTFNVYKEQPVDADATLYVDPIGPGGESWIMWNYDYEKFAWETIWELAGGYGKSCTLTSSLVITEYSENMD